MTKTNTKKDTIKQFNYSIYSVPNKFDENLWYQGNEIEYLVGEFILGRSLKGLPLKTRSKVAKSWVCQSLGYPVPSSFKKTRPRFKNQNLDMYVQKARNVQIWNEDIDPERRYLFIGLNEEDVVTGIRVITGVDLALLDTTGTLTQKFQARLICGENSKELISQNDTPDLSACIVFNPDANLKFIDPTSEPNLSSFLPIKSIFERLNILLGVRFRDLGSIQERNRGSELHKLICKSLGYSLYKDNGQFPDIKNQLLEVKLQTSPTIDLGLVCPDSNSTLDIAKMNDYLVQHKDVRYVLFYAKILEGEVCLTHIFLTTGQDFFKRFPKFGGMVLSKKLQMSLPKTFFHKLPS